MLKNFLPELERVSKSWPEHVDWPISQISMYTNFPGDEVAAWFSVGLERKVDEFDRVSLAEGEIVLEKLRGALANGESIKAKVFGDEAKESAAAWQKTKEKLLPFIAKKEWRSAYKNISYFMGKYEKTLAIESVLEAYGECLRFGIKAKMPSQELYLWLKNGIYLCLEEKTQKGIEDTLDLLDTYGDYFVVAGKAPLLEPFFKKIMDFDDIPALEVRLAEVKKTLEITG